MPWTKQDLRRINITKSEELPPQEAKLKKMMNKFHDRRADDLPPDLGQEARIGMSPMSSRIPFVIIVKVTFTSLFFLYCLFCNRSFPINPNSLILTAFKSYISLSINLYKTDTKLFFFFFLLMF